MGDSPAALGHIRDQVARALTEFVARQRGVLLAAGTGLVPGIEAIDELVAGGKRLRAAFCYWGWRGAGGEDCPEIFAAAACLELLHAGALIHDDVMDASDTRRGQPSLHRRFQYQHASRGWHGSSAEFGRGAAILMGDLLLCWTDEMFHESGLPMEALRRGEPVLDVMRTEVIAGQYLDLLAQAAGDHSLDRALRVAEHKSAKYTIERPLHLGAALAGEVVEVRGAAGPAAAAGTAGAGPAARAGETDAAGRAGAGPASRPGGGPVAAVYSAYGLPLGIAFQLRDDILGVFGDPAQTGKPTGDDVREGKRTVLLAIAASRASARQGAVLDRRLGDPLLDEAGADEVRQVIIETGALAQCEKMIDQHVSEALSALAGTSVTTEAKEALAELAVAATARHD